MKGYAAGRHGSKTYVEIKQRDELIKAINDRNENRSNTSNDAFIDLVDDLYYRLHDDQIAIATGFDKHFALLNERLEKIEAVLAKIEPRLTKEEHKKSSEDMEENTIKDIGDRLKKHIDEYDKD